MSGKLLITWFANYGPVSYISYESIYHQKSLVQLGYLESWCIFSHNFVSDSLKFWLNMLYLKGNL